MDLRQDKIKQQVINLTERVDNYQMLIEKEYKLLDKLQLACGHPNIELSGSRLSDHCPDCGLESRGWYCPTSPDVGCKYTDPETGRTDYDSCIYCGLPEQRK